ncbi:uncharacterized protein LOC142335221 isoform X1 [Convolutriloba macropyga]|uniref:uncharacterized protein LOC142335221 isoform X1 n=1 Tax=Convolutriloba macropyga TaxID=536237 RepID=UPI003F5241CF
MAPLNAIEAAYFEELITKNAAQLKEDRLKEFQKNLAARVAAKKSKEVDEANQRRAREATSVAEIKLKCRNIFAPKTHNAEKRTDSFDQFPVAQGYPEIRSTISVKSAKSKLITGCESRTAIDSGMDSASVTVVDCDYLETSELNPDLSTPRYTSKPTCLAKPDMAKRGTKDFAISRNLTRKAIMTIEREKAHERGQMMQRRKLKQSQNIKKSGLEHESFNLQLELSCEETLSSEDDQLTQHILTARTANTYVVNSVEDSRDREADQVTIRESSEDNYERRQPQSYNSKDKLRFNNALRRSTKEEVAAKKLTIPPLCLCGDSFWDLDPSNCAVNCPFYRNRKLYDRIVKAVLKSYDIQAKW